MVENTEAFKIGQEVTCDDGAARLQIVEVYSATGTALLELKVSISDVVQGQIEAGTRLSLPLKSLRMLN